MAEFKPLFTPFLWKKSKILIPGSVQGQAGTVGGVPAWIGFKIPPTQNILGFSERTRKVKVLPPFSAFHSRWGIKSNFLNLGRETSVRAKN